MMTHSGMPQTTHTAVHRFAYRGCDVSICLDGVRADGAVSAHARVWLAGVEVRHIDVDAVHQSGAAAVRSLAQQARQAIDLSAGSADDQRCRIGMRSIVANT